MSLAALLAVSALLPLARPAEAAGSDNLFPVGSVTLISGSPYTDSTTTSTYTRDSGEIGTCGSPSATNTHSAWYRYTPAANGWLDLDTLTSNYDTALEVFTATVASPTTFSQLTSVACNDDAGGGHKESQITLPVTSGETFYIAARDYGSGGSGGALVFHAAFSTQQIIYVNPATGLDVNPGTASLPVKTVQRGVDLVTSGNMVSLAASLYNESVVIDKALTLTGTAPLTVTHITLNGGAVLGGASSASIAAAVTINPGAHIQDGVTLIASGGVVDVSAGNYTETVTLTKRLTLQGASAATTFLEPATPANDALLITSSSPVTITGFTVRNATAAVRATGGSGHTLIGNNFLASVGVTATVSITATQNYWDDFSGPTHSANIGGLGTAASNNVAFSPWCTSPAPACTPLSAVPTVLTFTVQPTDTLKDDVILPLPVVRAQDANGIPALNFYVPVTLSTNLYGGLVISGTNPATAVAGVVTHTIAITQAGTGYTLIASAPSVWALPPAISNVFRVFSHPPVAYGDTFTINEDAPDNPLDVLANDVDPDLDALQILTVTAPAHGTLITSTALITYTPIANYFGADVFTYTMSDIYLSGVSTATVTVTVTPVNDAPSFVKGANQIVNEDAPAQTVNNWATSISPGPNESGQAVTFTVTNDNNALFSAQPVLSSAGTLSYTPTPDMYGSATVTVTATDDGGVLNGGINTSAPQSFTITINSVNDVPSFAGGGDVTVLEDSGAYSAAWASAISPGPANENTQTVTFTVSNTNTPLFSAQPAIASNGALTFTPAANAFGAATVTVRAVDNGGTANGGVNTSAAQTFVITVTAVNDAPLLDAISNPAAINEDASTQTVNLSGIGPGASNESQTLTVSAVSGDLTLIPNPTVVYTSSNATGSLRYAPVANAFGPTLITVTVQDNGGVLNGGADTITHTFTVTVNPVNDAPSFSGDVDVSVAEDSSAYSGAWASGISPGPANESGQVVTFTVSNTNTVLFSVQPTIDSSGMLAFAPANNANGSAMVTVRAVDNGGVANGGVNTSAAQTFTITVTAVNDAPSFTKGSDRTVLEDAGPQTITNWATSISRGPSDEAGQTLTFTLTNDNNALFTAQPALSSAGALTFTPAPNLNGSATVTATLQDSGGTANGGADTSAPQTFVITVTAVNDAPSFLKGSDVPVAEDAGAQTMAGWATGLSRGPSDEGGQTLTFALTPSVPSLFSAAPSVDPATGDLSFTPAANAFGSSSVTIVLTDNGGTANSGVNASAAQTFVITVTAINDAPSFAISPTLTINEDAGPQSITNWATSISPGPANESGQTVTFTVTNDNNGLFTAPPALSTAGTLTFTPGPNLYGSATVTATLKDNGGTANGGADTSAPQTFVITVTPVNDPPTAQDDSFSVVENSAANALDVLANDTFAPDTGETLSVATVTPASHGTVEIVGGAVLSYTPTAHYSGLEVLTYTVSDGALTDTARVTVTVININDPLVTLDDVYTVTEDSFSNALMVLVNDSANNVDAGETLTLTAHTAVAHGTLIQSGTTSFRYTPVANFFGVDVFTYTVTDGVWSASAVVTITVTPVNDLFNAIDDSFVVNESSTSNGLDVLANDIAANVDVGEAITLTAVTPASHGAVVINGAGLVYTPTFGFYGADVFTYTATDGVFSDTARVTVNVIGINDPLTAIDDVFTITEDAPTALLVLTNDNAANVDVGEALTLTSVTAASQGAVVIFGATLLYTPTADYFGTDVFTYTVTDGVFTDTAVVTVTVLSVNDAPSFTTGPDVTVAEDSGAYSATWASGISVGPANENEQTLAFALTFTAPSLFSAGPTLDVTGTLAFTPAPNAFGVTTVTVVMQDNGGVANGGVDAITQTFTITITPVNDPPTANDDAFTVSTDSINNLLDVLANDTIAPDTGETLTITAIAPASHGAAIIAGAQLAYTPTTGFVGTDTFTYTVSDGVLTDTATATMTVAAPTFVYLPLVTRPRVAAPGCVLLYNADGPKAIPDNDAAGVESVINVPNTFALTNLTVGIEALLHGYASDLDISLVAPDGRAVLMIYRLGADGDNFIGTRLNDAFATSIESGAPPFTGDFRPDNPLSTLYSMNAAGAWKLKVVDNVAGDAGVLNSWSLELCEP